MNTLAARLRRPLSFINPLPRLMRPLKRVFGCWHPDLTAPFTIDGDTYRSCTSCGARRHFDVKTFKTVGPYYYPEKPHDRINNRA